MTENVGVPIPVILIAMFIMGFSVSSNFSRGNHIRAACIHMAEAEFYYGPCEQWMHAGNHREMRKEHVLSTESR